MHVVVARALPRALSALFVVIAFHAGFARPAEAANVTLAWDSNYESDVAGYLITYGTRSGQPDQTVDVGNHTSYRLTNLATGRTYYFAVIAYNTRGQRSSPSAEVSTTIGSTSLRLDNFIVNPTSPRQAGTTMIFAAAPSGGTTPYQYKWMLYDGTRTSVLRDWSSESTFSWTPIAPNPNYAITAWVRNANNRNDAPDAQRTVPFAITPPDPTRVTLVADRQSPQPPGTRITFTATASGGTGPYDFQWSVFNGSSWSVQQDWSRNGQFSWTPSSPNSNYQVMVRVRGGQSLGSNPSLAMPFPIQ